VSSNAWTSCDTHSVKPGGVGRRRRRRRRRRGGRGGRRYEEFGRE